MINWQAELDALMQETKPGLDPTYSKRRTGGPRAGSSTGGRWRL